MTLLIGWLEDDCYFCHVVMGILFYLLSEKSVEICFTKWPGSILWDCFVMDQSAYWSVGWQEGHLACKTSGVAVLVVTIFFYSSSCHHSPLPSSFTAIKSSTETFEHQLRWIGQEATVIRVPEFCHKWSRRILSYSVNEKSIEICFNKWLGYVHGAVFFNWTEWLLAAQ